MHFATWNVIAFIFIRTKKVGYLFLYDRCFGSTLG